jgi:hypothetical protein
VNETAVWIFGAGTDLLLLALSAAGHHWPVFNVHPRAAKYKTLSKKGLLQFF